MIQNVSKNSITITTPFSIGDVVYPIFQTRRVDIFNKNNDNIKLWEVGEEDKISEFYGQYLVNHKSQVSIQYKLYNASEFLSDKFADANLFYTKEDAENECRSRNRKILKSILKYWHIISNKESLPPVGSKVLIKTSNQYIMVKLDIDENNNFYWYDIINDKKLFDSDFWQAKKWMFLKSMTSLINYLDIEEFIKNENVEE